eukprot:240767-Chlamydomonas_euryale.AAC.1
MGRVTLEPSRSNMEMTVPSASRNRGQEYRVALTCPPCLLPQHTKKDACFRGTQKKDACFRDTKKGNKGDDAPPLPHAAAAAIARCHAPAPYHALPSDTLKVK